jgi:hypothetical protein
MNSADQLPPVLTQQELETPRTAGEMLAWVDATHARFNTKQLKAEARAGKHFADKLIHEARPMALFADRHFGASPQVVIKHVIGNQNYDGIVEDRRRHPDSIRFLEVTTTLKTYEDSLRMELLSEQGHVAAYGPVTAEGPRHKRVSITAEGIAREHKAIRDDHLKLVQQAVERKANKKYEKDTAVIVAVDDSVPFRENEDAGAVDRLAREVLLPMLKGTNFSLLALEGSNGLHLCYAIA